MLTKDDKTPTVEMKRVEKIDGFCRDCRKLTVHTKQGKKYECSECGKATTIEYTPEYMPHKGKNG